MNIRLNKKSIIMATYIILIAAIIALGATHVHAENRLIRENMPLVSAFLQGGLSDNTIAGPGFSILNADEQGIIKTGGLIAHPVCVTVMNLGKGPIRLVGMNQRSEDFGMIEPGQTKAICIQANTELTSLGLMATNGNGGHGIALWRVDMVHGNNGTP